MVVVVVNCMTGFILGKNDVVRRWEWKRSSTGSGCGLPAVSGEKISQLIDHLGTVPCSLQCALITSSTSFSAAEVVEHLHWPVVH